MPEQGQAQSALARIDLPARALKTIQEVRSNLIRLADMANLVSPFASIDYVPPMQRVSFRMVVIDSKVVTKTKNGHTTSSGTDCYRDNKFCEENERALTKTGILRLFRAAGISILESRRIDDRSDSRLVAWRVIIEVPELDGGFTRYEHTKELDFRPGSPQMAKMTEAQAIMAAVMMLENAETKALLRAARAALQLRQKYTVEELSKPFVIPVLVPDLDTTDPEIKRMVAAKALGITRDLYGSDAKPNRTIVIDTEKVESIDPTTGEVIEGDDDPAAANAVATGDMGDFDEAEIVKPEEGLCTCPCGCKTPVPEAAATQTKKNRGVVRCGACYPGRAFDADKHKALSSLGMTPEVTVTQAVGLRDAAVKREKEKAAAK